MLFRAATSALRSSSLRSSAKRFTGARASSTLLVNNVASSQKQNLFLGATALVSATSAFLAANVNTTKCDESLPVYGVPGTNQERTFLAVKPDGVQRGLIGDIIARFEKRGYKLVGLKMVS